MKMKFPLLKRNLRGKDTETKGGTVTGREERGEMQKEKHLEQEKERRNYRPGLRGEREAGEGEKRMTEKQKEERGMRRPRPK